MKQQTCDCQYNCTDVKINKQEAAKKSSTQLISKHYIDGNVDYKNLVIPKVTTVLTTKDTFGAILSRISRYRLAYTIKPGLYATGNPNASSDVFISANYKLSFDHLRKNLNGLNAWILVLDTKGINVWCAAGKGTFGTDELIHRINESKIKEVINHNRIIVPQLGGPGVNAPKVQQKTGLKIYYGPVFAKDIKTFLQDKYNASKKMRKITFSIKDRIILTPMELLPFFKKYPLFAILMVIIFSLHSKNLSIESGFYNSMPHLLFGLVAILTGAFFTPLLLPIIPCRAFSLKGLFLGTLITLFMYLFVTPSVNIFETLFIFIFYPAITSFIALQFTGSTTFTHLSGVNKEIKIALPFYIGSWILSIAALSAYLISTWRV